MREPRATGALSTFGRSCHSTGRRRLHSASAAWRTSFLCATLGGVANHALRGGQRMTNEGPASPRSGRGALGRYRRDG
jgi:hypothetical protein